MTSRSEPGPKDWAAAREWLAAHTDCLARALAQAAARGEELYAGEMQDELCEWASFTDHLNTHCRENGVSEARFRGLEAKAALDGLIAAIRQRATP